MTDLRSVPCIAYPHKYQKATQMEVIRVMDYNLSTDFQACNCVFYATVCKVCKKSNCNHEKIVSTLSKIIENTKMEKFSQMEKLGCIKECRFL